MVKIWNRWILWTIKIKVTIAPSDIKKLITSHSKIIIANHKSHLDSLVLWSIMPKEVFLCFAAKKELFKIPICGTILKYSGSIIIDRQNAQIAIHNLKTFFTDTNFAKTLVIYAEGTRSRDNNLLPFKRGPFLIAKEMGVPILPIIIHGTAKGLPSDKFWPKATTATVKILDPIPYEQLHAEDPNKTKNQLWQTMKAELLSLQTVCDHG